MNTTKSSINMCLPNKGALSGLLVALALGTNPVIHASEVETTTVGKQAVVSDSATALRELLIEIRKMEKELITAEREYVLGDGNWAPEVIAARRSEFLLDNKTKILALVEKRERLRAVRTTAIKEAGIEQAQALHERSAGPQTTAARRERAYTNSLSNSLNQAKALELTKEN